jgi:pimeloyl-ACP methyl ester carboxylesterase
VGHSNGGDTAMYFAKEHPDKVRQVVTLDNLRVPFVVGDKMKILSFRSDDPQFKTDPDVLPSKLTNGINVIKTQFMHTWMSDRGPDSAKERIQATLDAFLGGEKESELAPAPVDTKNLIVSNDAAPQP